MPEVTFQSAAVVKGDKTIVVLAMTEGTMQAEKAQSIGMLLYQSKDSDDEFWYYRHPTNIMAIRTLKKVLEGMGYNTTLKLENANGKLIDHAEPHQQESPPPGQRRHPRAHGRL